MTDSDKTYHCVLWSSPMPLMKHRKASFLKEEGVSNTLILSLRTAVKSALVVPQVTGGIRRRTLQQTEAGQSLLLPRDRCISSATPCDSPPEPAPPAGCSEGYCTGERRSSPSQLWWSRGRGRNWHLSSRPVRPPL